MCVRDIQVCEDDHLCTFERVRNRVRRTERARESETEGDRKRERKRVCVCACVYIRACVFVSLLRCLRL